MASQEQLQRPSQLSILKAITFRINSTPAEQLPHSITYLTGSLISCQQLLSSESKTTSKEASETSVTLHKFRTQLSTLLQDRSSHARWAAVVLVKCMIQLGDWEALSKCTPWVRGLLNILTKPDPPATKKLVIVTLTRIFLLTKEYPTLVRELTTPSLTPYVTSCLNLVFPKTLTAVERQNWAQRSLLKTVLQSFNTLLPRHPTIFRPYLTQLQLLVSQCVAPTTTGAQSKAGDLSNPKLPLDQETVDIAQSIYAQFHYSAPKASGPEEWTQSVNNTIKYTHSVADRVFRSVIEAWQSGAGIQNTMTASLYDEDPRETQSNSLNLPLWTGLYAGAERLSHLIDLLRQFIINPTSGPVNVPLGLLLDLISRLLSLAVPYGAPKNWQDGLQFNPSASRDERVALFSLMPQIHVAAIELVLALIDRFQAVILPLAHTLFEDLVALYEAEHSIPAVRTALFVTLTALIKLAGASLSKSQVAALSSAIRTACQDLLPSVAKPSTSTALEKGQTNGLVKQPSEPSAQDKARPTTLPGLESAASSLLSTYISTVPAPLIPLKLRTEIERVAVLRQDKELLIAAVLNPSSRQGKQAASILPLAARLFPDEPALEAVMRPRMPVLTTRGAGGDDGDIVDDEDEDGVEETHEEDEDMESEDGDAEIGPDVEAESELATHPLPATMASISPAQSTTPSAFSTDPSHPPSAASHLKRRAISSSLAQPSSPKRTRAEVTSPVAAAGIPGTGLSTSFSAPELPHIQAATETVGGAKRDAPEYAERARDAAGEVDSDEEDEDFGELVLGPDSEEDEEMEKEVTA